MFYGIDDLELYRHAAAYVDGILRLWAKLAALTIGARLAVADA
jgi:hypothetical protein